MSEAFYMRRMLLSLSELGGRFFRNQVGKYFVVRSSRCCHCAKELDGRWISDGLCVGSSDLIGWKSITVSPDMVGRRLAIFAAIETKDGDEKATPEQTTFLLAVLKAGGISILSRPSSTDQDLLKFSQWGSGAAK